MDKVRRIGCPHAQEDWIPAINWLCPRCHSAVCCRCRTTYIVLEGGRGDVDSPCTWSFNCKCPRKISRRALLPPAHWIPRKDEPALEMPEEFGDDLLRAWCGEDRGSGLGIDVSEGMTFDDVTLLLDGSDRHFLYAVETDDEVGAGRWLALSDALRQQRNEIDPQCLEMELNYTKGYFSHQAEYDFWDSPGGSPFMLDKIAAALQQSTSRDLAEKNTQPRRSNHAFVVGLISCVLGGGVFSSRSDVSSDLLGWGGVLAC